MKRAPLVAALLVPAALAAPFYEGPFEVNIDDFTGDWLCLQTVGDPNDPHVPVVTLAEGDGAFIVVFSRNNLDAGEVGHNPFVTLPGERLYLRFPDGTVAEMPLERSKAELKDLRWTSQVSVWLDPETFARLQGEPGEVRYRIEGARERFDGRFAPGMFASFAGFSERCAAEQVNAPGAPAEPVTSR